MITSGVCPYLYLFYKKTQVKQYLKEGRALRTETTLNQPRDFGIGKELTNLAAMAEVGYAASRRLLDAECISHDPADGAAALEAITSPVISTTCTRIPGMRFPDPRVQALLGACCALALRPAGFTSRDLRHYLAPLLGRTPEDMTSGQISYDLRRLRAHQIIERIPHSRTYQVTTGGLTIALFLTRLAQRLLIPGLAQLASPGPPGRSRLRQADRAYRDALTDLAQQASLAALPPPAAITRSNHETVISRHTRRNLTRNSKSLRGKITYLQSHPEPGGHRVLRPLEGRLRAQPEDADHGPEGHHPGRPRRARRRAVRPGPGTARRVPRPGSAPATPPQSPTPSSGASSTPPEPSSTATTPSPWPSTAAPIHPSCAKQPPALKLTGVT